MTLVEILIAMALGTVVIVPVYAVLTLTLKSEKPVRESNRENAQFRLFRTQMLRDWSKASIIRIGTTYVTGGDVIECANGTSGAYFSVNSPYNVVGPLIALQTVEAGNSTPPRRIVYNLIPAANGPAGTYDLVRRECDRNTNGTITLNADTGGWRTSPGSILATNGSVTTVAWGVTAVTLPTTCNTLAEPLPYEACDANVTLTGTDGRSVTLRLYQQIGRPS